MSNVTLNSPQLAPILATSAPEAAAPLPNEGDDVVEAYSFNTGDLTEAAAAKPTCIGISCRACSACLPASQVVCQYLIGFLTCAGLMVLMMILYASLGHKIAARCADNPSDCCWRTHSFEQWRKISQ